MTTGNAQIGANMSYSGLRERHFKLENQSSATRKQSDYDFQIHKHVVLDSNAFDDLQARQEKLIEERNQKYIKRREHKKCDKNLAEYFERRQGGGSRKKGGQGADKFSYNNHFPLLLVGSNVEQYNQLLDVLSSTGFKESDLRRLMSEALEDQVQWFNGNEKFKGIFEIDEYYLHANEEGVPHIHARLLMEDYDRYGMPNGNLGSTLKKVYGTKYNKNALVEFRQEVDNKLMDCLERRLGNYFMYTPLNDEQKRALRSFVTLQRTQGKVFDDQQSYKNAMRLKELDEREEKLNEREEKLQEKEEKMKSSEAEFKDELMNSWAEVEPDISFDEVFNKSLISQVKLGGDDFQMFDVDSQAFKEMTPSDGSQPISSRQGQRPFRALTTEILASVVLPSIKNKLKEIEKDVKDVITNVLARNGQIINEHNVKVEMSRRRQNKGHEVDF